MLGQQWLGAGYQEMGGSGTGVFRGADGTQQFRIDQGSITGSHGDVGPHSHLERINPNRRGRNAIDSNNHIPTGLMMEYPLKVWGNVLTSPNEEYITAVRIERSIGSSFLILTRENGEEFDTWVESESDVLDYLNSISIKWPDLG